jgi:hypothetical protein
VQSKPGVSNSKGVRDALTALEQVEITVPVWDVAAGQGANANYHVAYFAVIRIIGYDIPGGVITAQFIGYSDCNVGAPNWFFGNQYNSNSSNARSHFGRAFCFLPIPCFVQEEALLENL